MTNKFIDVGREGCGSVALSSRFNPRVSISLEMPFFHQIGAMLPNTKYREGGSEGKLSGLSKLKNGGEAEWIN